jgi:MFS family permease
MLRCARAARLVCLAVAAASAVPALYDLWKTLHIAFDQVHGPAEGTDFLNLYAGASLFATSPQSTYDLDAQLALQQSLTQRQSLLVPYYLPPYAGPLVAWLDWLPYSVGYVVWLGLGIVCIALAAHWLAPRWTPLPALVWLPLALCFLPILLGLAQGQTAPLMLLCATAFTRGMLATGRRRAWAQLVFGSIGLALKPQLVPLYVLVLARRGSWRPLAAAGAFAGVLLAVAITRLGPTGLARYSTVSAQKMSETLFADPTFLIGPTLLHASRWFIGPNIGADVLAGLATAAVLAVFARVWWHRPASDDQRLLQLATLPLAAIVCAPYALIYELTLWLVSFWLVWQYSETRPAARAELLWLTALTWLAADVGVMLPLTGGADFAALLGVYGIVFIARLFERGRCAAAGNERPEPGALLQSAGPRRV